MDVLRGQLTAPLDDRCILEEALDRAAHGRSALRVWTPPRQVAFGRRDVGTPGYSRARALASDHGFPPVERRVGGHAVAHTGHTLAFAVALPNDERAGSIDDRYDIATAAVIDALEQLGAAVDEGEPDGSFCPGTHSIRVADGGKLSGIAQRVGRDVVLVAGCLLVTRSDAATTASVLDPIYRALDVEFDPDTVGCVALAGGSSSIERVARSVEASFLRSPWGSGSGRLRRVESGG